LISLSIPSKMLRKLTGRRRHLGLEKYQMGSAGYVIAWLTAAKLINNWLSSIGVTECLISRTNSANWYALAAKKEIRRGQTVKNIHWSFAIAALLTVSGP